MLTTAAVSALALVTAACGHDGSQMDTAPSGPAPLAAASSTGTVDRDVALVIRAIADEQRLLSFCTAAASRFGDQQAVLGPLSSRQGQHVSRLRATLTDLHPALGDTHRAVPRTAPVFSAALRQLVAQIRDNRTADCQAARAGLLAELFAAVAASHAMTVHLLDPRFTIIPVDFPAAVASVTGLQSCLAAEHAAVFGYALLGGVLAAGASTAPAARLAVASYDEHRRRRDSLTELIADGGGAPAVASATYQTPFRVGDLASARHLARVLESRCASVYAQATAQLSGDGRLLTSATLLDCATRGGSWGASVSAFPGLTT